MRGDGQSDSSQSLEPVPVPVPVPVPSARLTCVCLPPSPWPQTVPLMMVTYLLRSPISLSSHSSLSPLLSPLSSLSPQSLSVSLCCVLSHCPHCGRRCTQLFASSSFTLTCSFFPPPPLFPSGVRPIGCTGSPPRRVFRYWAKITARAVLQNGLGAIGNAKSDVTTPQTHAHSLCMCLDTGTACGAEQPFLAGRSQDTERDVYTQSGLPAACSWKRPNSVLKKGKFGFCWIKFSKKRPTINQPRL